ncbi:MAG: UvrD-helicase domain-containing protein [Spirochaetota bacterium]
MNDLLIRFSDEVRQTAWHKRTEFRCINDFILEQDQTNAVRHAFKDLDIEDARGAASRLLSFCSMAGVSASSEVEALKASLKLWDERSSRLDDIERITRLGYQLAVAKGQRDELEKEVGQLRAFAHAKKDAENRLRVLESELEQERTARRQSSARSDEIRREKAGLKQEVASLEDKISELSTANDYILGLTRMTLYTRSRIDYERELVKLSSDQQQILSEITLGGDFLVKGGAGTGKTLVLLEALGKLLRSAQDTGSANHPSFALITYSDTLVKYDRYVASIIDLAEREERILSADVYLESKLGFAAPGAVIDAERFAEIIDEEARLSFMSSTDAAEEIEGYLFANDVTEREYCVDLVERSGMKSRLSTEQRRAVWELRQRVALVMEAEKRYSRNYSRTKIRAAVQADTSLATDEYLFIDEVQDLAPVDLMALKALTKKAIIMAGDNDQAIFRKGFSFKRAGIDIVGKSRTIKLNFRNTIQINDLAERYRHRLLPDGDISKKAHERPSQAFRPGPSPELLSATDKQGLLTKLHERISVLIDLLRYEPRNLTVLVPDLDVLDETASFLRGQGLEVDAINDSTFEFGTSTGIRISTMHLAKGIDFATVLLFLPHAPRQAECYDELFRETMTRNLVYVCMTRAMEQLVILALDEPSERALRDLVSEFEEARE